jgi:hypothetical protein
MLQQNNVNFAPYTVDNLFGAAHDRRMFADCNPRVHITVDISVTGYETIPYPFDGGVEVLPAFYTLTGASGEALVCPCLLLSIFRHFHRGVEVNLSPFMVEPSVQLRCTS